MCVELYILDDQLTSVFETSTDLLGHGYFDLEEGDVYTCTFEVSLNFADGTYYPSSLIYRRDIQTIYDKCEPATTIYISSNSGVRGIVNCFPQVIRQGICKALDANPAAIVGETTTGHGKRGRD